MEYVCPMHPEVVSGKSGKCPKCGMKLIKSTDYDLRSTAEQEAGLGNNYTPLFVIIGLIALASLGVLGRDYLVGSFSWRHGIEYFMIGFFLVFSGFKLINIKGFAEGYSMYDLLAKKWFGYGFIYPFIELGFGLLMILGLWLPQVLVAEIIVMVFSGIGVLLKMLKHEKFQCACLGTFLKVPLTKVTLIEDFGMALLATILLVTSL